MDMLDQFAQTVDGFARFATTAAELSLEERLHKTRSWLSALYQAGTALETTEAAPQRPLVKANSWPDFGRFEEFWALFDPHGHEAPELCHLSQELEQIADELIIGLNLYLKGDQAKALSWWCQGFEEGYGPRVLWVLPALHAALQNFRVLTEVNTKPRTATIVMLDDASTPPPGVMGLRLMPVEGGAEIVAVHPRGPAEGKLFPGDLLLAIDADPVQGDSPESLGQELGGGSGTTRSLSIYRSGETSEIQITLVNPEELSRAIQLKVLIPEAAVRAARALQILGCEIQFVEPNGLHIHPAPEVSPADVDALIAAGETNSIWMRAV